MTATEYRKLVHKCWLIVRVYSLHGSTFGVRLNKKGALRLVKGWKGTAEVVGVDYDDILGALSIGPICNV